MFRNVTSYGDKIANIPALADLPAASADNVGAVAYVSDGIAGAAGLIVSNGTNWVYVSDNTTVAATS